MPRVTGWASAPLSYRAARTPISPTSGSARWFVKSRAVSRLRHHAVHWRKETEELSRRRSKPVSAAPRDGIRGPLLQAPSGQRELENRKRCRFDLKDIGYQVGSGVMVGFPCQTTEHLIADLRFLQELRPAMIGIGSYITHAEMPFAEFESGGIDLTLHLVAILRLMFPHALIPATIALSSIHPQGWELGLKAGANVVRPNLSPVAVRKLYDLYENKICTGEESARCRSCLESRVRSAGYRIDTVRGDVIPEFWPSFHSSKKIVPEHLLRHDLFIGLLWLIHRKPLMPLPASPAWPVCVCRRWRKCRRRPPQSVPLPARSPRSSRCGC